MTRTSDLQEWTTALLALERDVSDADRIEQIRRLEELKAAAAAAQARISTDIDRSQRRVQAEAGVPAARRGAGVASQVALARRESPVRGGQHLGLAKALVHEMPCTLAALSQGRLSEWRATVIVRETACLTREHRALVDRELCADPSRLDGLGDRAVAAEAKRIAYRLDAAAAVRRARKAVGDRCVTIRPAPDTMAYVTALLPVAQAVGVYAALRRAADSGRAAGDRRSRNQLMADTLVERVTGLSRANETRVEVQLVITDKSLLAGDDEPAHVPGYGPVPAAWARDLVAAAAEAAAAATAARSGEKQPGAEAVVWLRRLFTHPRTGELVAADSSRRAFPAGLRAQITTRDQVCRTPWCDAPVRHIDHARAHERGGQTSVGNGQGLCERCNYAKQAPGWSAHGDTSPDDRHEVRTTTPTGHQFSSRPPPLPGPRRDAWSQPVARSRLELHFSDLTLIA